MRKKSTLIFFRMALLLAVLLLGNARYSLAQFDFTIGTHDGDNLPYNFFLPLHYPCPLQDNSEGARAQYLYRASELTAAGMVAGEVNAIRFSVTATNRSGIIENMVFRVGVTSVTELDASQWETLGGAVATVAADYKAVAGVNTFTLPVPFIWNGTDNIIVEVCNGAANNATAGVTTNTYNNSVPYSYLSFVGSHTYAANNIGAGCGTASTTEAAFDATYRPVITFSWSPAITCDGSFDAGNTLANVSSICGGDSVSLSWDGALAKGFVYQWQRSDDNVIFADIAGAASFKYRTNQAGTSWYRLKITCNNGAGTTKYANSIKVVTPDAVSGIFTINNSVAASDPAAGVFKSFNDGYNYIKCGISGPVVFNVVNTGTPYNEQLKLLPVSGTSAANTITFNGNGATISYAATDPNEIAVIKLVGADYFVFNNLKVGVTGTSAVIGIQLMNDADYNMIKNCTVSLDINSTEYNSAGLVINASDAYISSYDESNCDYNTFDHNTITGGSYGIALFGYSSSAIQHNSVTNNTIKNIYQCGIYFSYTSFTNIEGNDISMPDRTTSYYNVYGIYGFQLSTSLKVNKNKVHHFFQAQPENAANPFAGMRFHNLGGELDNANIVSNNLIYEIVGRQKTTGISSTSNDATLFCYNSVSLDDANSTSTESTMGFYESADAAGLSYYNNVISVVKAGGGKKYATYFDNPAGAGVLFSSDNNDWHVADNATSFVGYYNGTVAKTLANWQAATGKDANSFNAEPGFTDVTTGNLKPTTVVIMDKGVPLSVTTDADGVTRSATKPDPGAYEYNLPGCTAGSSAGDAYASSGTTSCPYKQITLNLKNYDPGAGLTFTWESSPNPTGPWTAISDDLNYPAFTYILGNATLYYRAAVSCNGGNPVRSTAVKVDVTSLFPAGTYTIDKTQPTDPSGTKNFNSFTDAVAAIACGVAGPVVFNVKPGTYVEQVRISEITGTSPVNTITFRSEDNNPASATLQHTASSSADNYVVRLDSAKYINFKALTVESTDPGYGIVFDVANTASCDSIVSCVINAPVAYDVRGANAGVYAVTGYMGDSLVIKGNTFSNGANGVWIDASGSGSFADAAVVDGNTISGAYSSGVYARNTTRLRLVNNTITVNTPNTSYGYAYGVFMPSTGIYTWNCDTAFQITGNTITASDNAGVIAGILMNGNSGGSNTRGKVANNKIVAVDRLGSTVYGLYNTGGNNLDVINNTVSVSGSAVGTDNSEYTAALWTQNSKNTNYYNNTFLNSSAAPGVYNVAMYLDHEYGSTGGNTNIKNNVLANTGGGPAALYLYDPYSVKSDYNLLYSKGGALVSREPEAYEKQYATLADWVQEYGLDFHSIVYEPGIISTVDLSPDVANASSWAMQGRGIHIEGNNVDINGKPRSVSLTEGVPDIGAYEFLPTVAPPALTATPSIPAAGITQTFTMGSDTVMKVAWAAGTAVPASLSLHRYSGVLPDGLAATEKSMYYYVDADAAGAGVFKYNVQLNYIDPWLRNLDNESIAKIGKTDAGGKWNVSATGRIDSILNLLVDSTQEYLGKFTVMTDGKAAVKPVFTTTADSSNFGTRFWLPYPMDKDFWLFGNGQELKLQIAAVKDTKVTVSVNGSTYKKYYTVPANGVLTTDALPKSGEWDARIMAEGKWSRSILVESEDPVAVNAWMSAKVSAVVLPAGTYAKDYTALGYKQITGYDPEYATSYVTVVADNDNTVVEITPSVPTAGGRVAGVPFRVTLNRGEMYQVQGAYKATYYRDDYIGNAYEDYDLTGTRIVSVPNSGGICMPITTFTGSSGTGITCSDTDYGGDLPLYQQNMPAQAWGKHYLLTPPNTAGAIGETMYVIYRVQVKEPNTIVKRGGVVLSGLQNNNYYEFLSNTGEAIDADKPVMVAQYQPYYTSCYNDISMSSGSRERMTYLTPLGYGVDSVIFFRLHGTYFNGATFADDNESVTVTVPDGGLSSLKINGSNSFDQVITHPANPAFSIVTKRWISKDTIGHITCDSNFYGAAYMPRSPDNSYHYNLGFQIPRVNLASGEIKNEFNNTGLPNVYTCAGTNFKPSIALPVAAKSLVWRLSGVAGATPSTDITVSNPVPVDTVEVDYKNYYRYELNQNMFFSTVGSYVIPVTATYTENGASCDKSVDGSLVVTVKPAPIPDFTTVYAGCVNSPAVFDGSVTSPAGSVADRWNWTLGDDSVAHTQEVSKVYIKGGTYTVTLQTITADACAADTSKDIIVNAAPMAEVVSDSVGTCPGNSATFTIKNPVSNVAYNWYNTNAGGTPAGTATEYTVNNVTAKVYYYVGTELNGCSSDTMKRVVAYIIPVVPAAVAEVDSVGVYSVRFKWDAVPDATGYEVSVDNGLSWISPSSGSTGTTHLITGLKPMQTVTLIVRALGGCEVHLSNTATATTLSDKVFIPNSFTPNGDGQNDVLKVYSNNIKTLKLMIFNQWGEKVFETADVNYGWNGSYGGKPQPSGVYMYVSKIELTTGEVIEKKGTINLVR